MNDLIGTTVAVPGNNRANGILKFMGQIRGKSGTFGGVELCGSGSLSRGKNNGDFDGVQYFQVTQEMTGLFLPWERLRAANPSLPALERPKTLSMGVNRDSVHTPTPSQRGSPASRGSNGHGGASSRISASSITNSFNRGMYKSDSLSSISSASPRVIPLTPKKEVSHKNISDEASELRAQLAQKTRDFDRKEAILLELQSTVDQLHPVLEEYERNIEDKERRLRKQRNDYDRAREEWRQSLDLMLESQQEAENLYEMQITDLKEEIKNLAEGKHKQNEDVVSMQLESLQDQNTLYKGKITELEFHLKAMQKENEDLKADLAKSIQNAETQKPAESDDSELVLSLKHKVEMLTQDVMSLEIVLQDSKANVRAKNTEIAELEIKLEEATSGDTGEAGNVSASLDHLTLDKWEEEKTQYKQTIDYLQKKLQEAIRVSESSSKNSQVSEAELAELSEQNNVKTSEIEKLKSQIQSLIVSHSKTLEEAKLSKNEPGESEKATIERLVEEKENLESTVEYLKKQLDKQHDDFEFVKLQKSLEESELLHEEESAKLQKELEASKRKLDEFQSEITSLQQKLSEATTACYDNTPHTPQTISYSPTKSMSIPRIKGGPLPIYKPQKQLDPSDGRDDWCGLCERDGHDSLHCPYENDIF